MNYIDVFNGDADGICALIQLRQSFPIESRLITGVKRDIKLLDKVSVQTGDKVTVLDVSLEKNVDGLNRVLGSGAEVLYVDHHFPGEIPKHSNLQTLITTAADSCTSIIVNKYLNNRYREWAVVGAFGDNLQVSARALAKPLNFTENELNNIENLGIYINYNGYGATIADLHFSPDVLFRKMNLYPTPREFMMDDSETYELLESGYKQDMAIAQTMQAVHRTNSSAVFMLPDTPWARRVSGVYGNALANLSPDQAHAILTPHQEKGYVVSVRAPLNNKTGADDICRLFPTGGGRKAAAGINLLPEEQVALFIDRFSSFYSL